MKTFCCFLFLFLFLLFQFSYSVQILNSNYTIKSGTVLETPISLVEFTFETDQPLYKLDSNECPNFNLSNADNSTCFCDYTQHSVSRCGISNSSSTFDCNCNNTYFCDTNEYVWETLYANQSIFSFVVKGEYLHYRFLVTEPLTLVTLDLVAFSGSPEMFVSTDGPIQGRYYEIRAFKEGGQMLVLCPSYLNFTLGTYFLAVLGVEDSYYSLSISMTHYVSPNHTVIGNCTPIITGADCLLLNEEVESTIATSARRIFTYTPNFTGCQILSFNLWSLTGDSDIFITNEPFFRNYSSLQRGIEDRIVMNYCVSSSNRNVFFQIIVYGYVGGSYVLSITSPPPIFDDLTKMNPYQAKFKLMNIANLFCPSTTFVCIHIGSCRSYYSVFPATQPRPLWPIPLDLAYMFHLTPNYYPPANNLIPQSNKLVIVFLLFIGNIEDQFNYFNPAHLPNCNFTFLETLVGEDGSSLPSFLSVSDIELVPADCDYEDFVNLDTEIRVMMENVSQSNTPIDLVNLNYAIDSTTLVTAWVGCSNFANEMLAFVDKIYEFEAQICRLNQSDPLYNADPCCSMNGTFYSCCEQSNDSLLVPQFDQVSNNFDFSQCHHPDCVKSFANEYGLLLNLISDQEIGCASILSHSIFKIFNRVLTFFDKCFTTIFGPDGRGIQCTSDVDCEYTCDQSVGRCFTPIQEQENHFLQCFIDNMPLPVQLYLSFQIPNLPEIPSSDINSTYFLLVQKYLSNTDCRGEIDMALEYRFHYAYVPIELGCHDKCTNNEIDPNFYVCATKFCTLPTACFQYAAGACDRLWEIETGSSVECLSEYICNWNDCDGLTFDQCKSLCSSISGFCGWCQGKTCYPVPDVTTAEECSNLRSACVLSNGTVITNLSASQCNSIGNCAHPLCPSDPNCNSQVTCNSFGSCESDLYFPACVYPMIIRNNFIACPYPEMRLTPTGCSYLNGTDETTCIENGGTYYNLARNQSTCQAEYGCLDYDFYYLALTYQDNSSCTNCGGFYQPTYRFFPAHWFAGNLRNVSWVTPSFQPLREFTSTLNYSRITSVVQSAAARQYSFALTTNLFCRYDKRIQLLGQISCDCFSNNSDCFSTVQNPDIGLGRVCPGNINTQIINAPPCSLTFPNNSVSSTNCITFKIYTLLATQFQRPAVITLASDFSRVPSSSPFASVVNFNNVVVGQILGDGIILSFEFSPESVGPFRVCLDVRSDIPYLQNNFPILDFGITNLEKNILRPLDIEVYTKFVPQSSVTQICGNIPSGLSIQSRVLFPIGRVSDWQDIKPISLNTLEIVATIVLGSAFVLIGAFVLLNIILLNRKQDHRTQLFPKKLLFSLFLVVDILRLLYFYLLPIGVLNPAHIITFFLSEFPTVVLFSSLTLIIYVWVLVATSSSPTRKQFSSLEAIPKRLVRNVKLIFICINVIIYTLLLLLLVLFEAVPNKTTVQNLVCGILNTDPIPVNQTSQWKISLSYRLLIAVLSFIVTAAFFFYGTSVYRNLRQMIQSAYSSNRSTMNRKRMVLRDSFTITFIGGLCFIIYTALLVTKVVIRVTSAEIAIILFIFISLAEIILQIVVTLGFGYKRKPKMVVNENSKLLEHEQKQDSN